MFVLQYELSFFYNLSRKYCCDANIVAMKCVHFESHFDQYQLLSTANAKYFNIDLSCSNFRNESNGIFVRGGLFFFRQIST